MQQPDYFPDVWVKVPKDKMLSEEECPPTTFRSIMCPHNKTRRDYCAECGGSQICPCGNIKAICKQCKGSQLCAHQKQWSLCSVCKKEFTCPHGKHRLRCKECKKCKRVAKSFFK